MPALCNLFWSFLLDKSCVSFSLEQCSPMAAPSSKLPVTDTRHSVWVDYLRFLKGLGITKTLSNNVVVNSPELLADYKAAIGGCGICKEHLDGFDAEICKHAVVVFFWPCYLRMVRNLNEWGGVRGEKVMTREHLKYFLDGFQSSFMSLKHEKMKDLILNDLRAHGNLFLSSDPTDETLYLPDALEELVKRRFTYQRFYRVVFYAFKYAAPASAHI